MPITSPALSMSIEALFGAIRPTTDVLKKIGPTDFSADAPATEIQPGKTIKVPVSSIDAAVAYDEESNNYLTGGKTDWATLTATHFLRGYDISGVDVDSGVNAARMKQLFALRAGGGIAAAMAGACASALDGLTASTAVTLSATPTLQDYIALGSAQKWLDKPTSTLVLNGAELAALRAAAAANNLAGSDEDLAAYLGFGSIAVVPGMTARAVIAPNSSIGFLARVPTIIADYMESGVETDEESGLAVGIVVADSQATNKIVVNADLWFGVTALSSNAGATTPGAIKIGAAG